MAKKYIGHVHATVTIYTIFSLPSLINWCINNEIELKFYTVHQDNLNPALLPMKEKDKILSKFKRLNLPSEVQEEVVRYLKSLLHTFNNPNLAIEFKKRTTKLDKIRNQSFIDIVPELKDWYLSIKGD